MGVFIVLALLFTITPLVELYILIRIGQVIGALETVLLVLAMGAAGAALARAQGYAVVREFQAALGRGQMPTDQILDGFLVFAGAALMVAPGVLTDILGVLLVAPPTRKIFRNLIKSRMALWMGAGALGFTIRRATGGKNPKVRGDDDDVIDI